MDDGREFPDRDDAAAETRGGRQCIIVSPYFPPSTLAGVHRARHLARHLPSFGWTPTVLCVDEAFHEERLDPELAGLVPKTVEVRKVVALPARLTRRVGLGEISLRAYPYLRRELMRLLATAKYDAVLITGSPYYPMLLAGEIRRRFGVPVVLDFQDPWLSDWGAGLPRLSKGGLSHALAAWLEPRALRAADFVTSVSRVQNEQLARRYPYLTTDRMAAMPIGADPEDLRLTAVDPARLSELGVDASAININYIGTIWPRALPVLEVVLRAIGHVRRTNPALSERLRVNFVGTSNQPSGFGRMQVMPLAERAGAAGSVYEIPQRVPYLDAIRLQNAADGLLLLGSDEPHYVASKIHASLMSGKPYLSLYHRESAAHAAAVGAGGGLALCFSSAEELAALEPQVGEALVRLATAPDSFGIADPATYRESTAQAVAGRFASIFDRLTEEGGR